MDLKRFLSEKEGKDSKGKFSMTCLSNVIPDLEINYSNRVVQSLIGLTCPYLIMIRPSELNKAYGSDISVTLTRYNRYQRHLSVKLGTKCRREWSWLVLGKNETILSCYSSLSINFSSQWWSILASSRRQPYRSYALILFWPKRTATSASQRPLGKTHGGVPRGPLSRYSPRQATTSCSKCHHSACKLVEASVLSWVASSSCRKEKKRKEWPPQSEYNSFMLASVVKPNLVKIRRQIWPWRSGGGVNFGKFSILGIKTRRTRNSRKLSCFVFSGRW